MHYAAQKVAGMRQYPMAPVRELYYFTNLSKDKRERVNAKLNCTKQFQPGNIVKYSYGSIRHVIEQRGRYVKVQMIGDSRTNWHNASIFDFVAIDSREYEFQKQIKQLEAERDVAKANAESAKRQDLVALSRNTVTRALVHAHNNDYCQETAVALISAGHQLPDVTLDLNVTVRLSLTLKGNRSYYELRTLFGATQGDMQNIAGKELNHSRMFDRLHEGFTNGNVEISYVSDVKANSADIDWKAPVIRQLSQSEAQAQFEEAYNND